MLVDDHAVVRAGFRMLLSTDDMIEVIAESDRGEVVCQLYLEKKPDVEKHLLNTISQLLKWIMILISMILGLLIYIVLFF